MQTFFRRNGKRPTRSWTVEVGRVYPPPRAYHRRRWIMYSKKIAFLLRRGVLLRWFLHQTAEFFPFALFRQSRNLNIFTRIHPARKSPVSDQPYQVSNKDHRKTRGYVKVGQECAPCNSQTHNHSGNPFMNETMEIDRDWGKTWKNPWSQKCDVPGRCWISFKRSYVHAPDLCLHSQSDLPRSPFRCCAYHTTLSQLRQGGQFHM
ncbi:hypothetical protein BC827DRAFT_773100 [Russula dissimulans]|jgi:hypothetical protein|nr:hypothetical protein BC827DRAFT_773100 [Russula dissimulans]